MVQPMVGDPQPLIVVGFGLAAALVLVTAWSRRLSGRTSRSRGPRVEWRLTAQHRVHVLDVQGVRLVIGTGPGSAPTFLYRLPASESPSAGLDVHPTSRSSSMADDAARGRANER